MSAPIVGGGWLLLLTPLWLAFRDGAQRFQQNYLLRRIAPPLTLFATLALTLSSLAAAFFLFWDVAFVAICSTPFARMSLPHQRSRINEECDLPALQNGFGQEQRNAHDDPGQHDVRLGPPQ